MLNPVLVLLSIFICFRALGVNVDGRSAAGGSLTGAAAITGGTASGLTQAGGKRALANYIGTTNATIDMLKDAFMDTTNAAASRFSLSNVQTDTNSTSECDITLVGAVGSVYTNVANNFAADGPWGTLTSPTTHLHFYWIGPALHMWQDPTVGISRPAQLVANTDDWNPVNFDIIEVVEFSTDASRNITGFKGMPDGRPRVIHNNGTQNAVFKNETTSTATNRLSLSADITLAGKQSLAFRYDLTALRWFAIGGIGGGSSATPTDVQIFTATTNVWTKPAGAKTVRVIAIGSGGGGGSGRRGPSLTAQGGGAGGSGGAHTFIDYNATDITATVAVAAGGGGPGGAAITVDTTSGNSGAAGTNSTFFTNCVAGGGGGGNGGTSATGGTAANGNRVNGIFAGNAAGAGSNGSATATAGTGGNNAIGIAAGGGGGGGGIDADGATQRAGGTGGHLSSAIAGAGSGGGAGGGTPGGTGGTAAASGSILPGAGGGGGGGRITGGAGGSGGNGGIYGGGGGGGGASINGVNSGAGGNGADGVVVVITYF